MTIRSAHSNQKSTITLNKYADKHNQGMPIEFRNSVDVNKYANKLKASEADKNCTFKPTVNENSKMIAQNRQNNDNRSNNVFQRLIANKEETLFDCRSSEMRWFLLQY